MFYSGISVKNLIEELKNTEVDIALDIPDATYVAWLNSLQQLLYSEIIKEQRRITQSSEFFGNPIDFGTIANAADISYMYDIYDIPRFEDIYAVYADKVQLKKSTLASGSILSNTFYKEEGCLAYNTKKTPTELTIVFIARPAILNHEDADFGDKQVMVPVEFIDLVKAKLRGEAYKLVNEDGIAAKWLNDYNMLLETFKAWIAEKSPNFGI